MSDVSQPQTFPLVSHTLEEANGAPICLQTPLHSHRETDETYPVIAKVGKVRVINCKDNLQWIVQKRRGGQWHGLSFCRTREVLIRDVRRRLRERESDPLPPVPAHALVILQALPEWHPSKLSHSARDQLSRTAT